MKGGECLGCSDENVRFQSRRVSNLRHNFHAFLLSNMSTWGDRRVVGGAKALLTERNAFYSAFDSMMPVSLW
ncbi:hypothetical protein H5410_050492 [Solanum commersonii]|uniref:Uncharacterized protein n=1 Tax=Solanum commersonii TaxID=4109 RepID=A0A9J5WVL8_SOLCO|nr:hypothetical protein H5410_050492 [Solanum commersonii]